MTPTYDPDGKQLDGFPPAPGPPYDPHNLFPADGPDPDTIGTCSDPECGETFELWIEDRPRHATEMADSLQQTSEGRRYNWRNAEKGEIACPGCWEESNDCTAALTSGSRCRVIFGHTKCMYCLREVTA